MQHGTHVIDRVRWLLGSEPTALCGRLIRDLTRAPVGPDFHHTLDAFAWAREHQGRAPAEDAEWAEVTADVGYDVLAEFGDGVRARFWEATHLTGPAEEEVTVIGEDGALSLSATAGLSFHRAGAPPEPVPVPGFSGSGARTRHETGLRRWEALVTSFLSAVRTGRPATHPTLADGWHVARIVDAVRRSDRTRRWETI